MCVYIYKIADNFVSQGHLLWICLQSLPSLLNLQAHGILRMDKILLLFII